MKKTKDKVFSISSKSSRAGASSFSYILYRSKGNLQRFIDSSAFELSIALLIFISVGLVFAEFFVPPGELLEDIIFLNDVLTWVFVIELLMRWIVAPSKKVYFKNYWIDILAVLPLLRVFRSFRILRLLRLLRLSRALVIFLRRAGWFSRQTERSVGVFALLFFTSLILIVCWTLVILTIEAPPSENSISFNKFLERIWSTSFLFISGEVIADLPESPWARLVEILVAVSGFLVFAFLVGAVSSMMSNYWKVKMDEKDLTISDLDGHTIICGWDRLGALILAELEMSRDLWQRGIVIVAEHPIDIYSETRVKNARRVLQIRDDFTKMDVLEKAAARRAKSAIILSDKGNNLTDQVRDARTVLAALTLEKLNPEIFTCAELLDEVNATHLKIAGVEEIVSRTNISAGVFASAVVNQGISTVVSDLLSQKDGAYLRKIEVPEAFVGKIFIEAFEYFKKEHSATVIAVDYAEPDKNYIEHHLNPDNNYVLQETDILILITKVDSKFSSLPS
ncbi:MAG TPA: ion transporter [Oligoflexia bacterium]|nr:ion transporter [Oligoflexia bacterium]HMP48451.1 ion transporter [Oligoflexia bacterium]